MAYLEFQFKEKNVNNSWSGERGSLQEMKAPICPSDKLLCL